MHGNHIISNTIDVAALAGFTEVTGHLTVQNTTIMPHMNGLDSLTSVGANLHIIATEFTNIDSLNALTYIGGNLLIDNSDFLPNVDGLASLTYVQGTVTIESNPELTNIDGLNALATIDGSLNITQNPKLCQSLVDAFVAGATIGGVVNTINNDPGC